MASTKSGPSAASFDKFLVHGQAHMGQMGKCQCTITGLDNATKLGMEKYRNMGSASLAATLPAGPWRKHPSSLEGCGVKFRHHETYQPSDIGWWPVKLLCITMFNISKIKPKSTFSPVKRKSIKVFAVSEKWHKNLTSNLTSHIKKQHWYTQKIK